MSVYFSIRSAIEIIDYITYFKLKKHKWNSLDGYNEHHPIINGTIIEPVNAFTSLFCLIAYGMYNNTPLENIQKDIVLSIAYSSFGYHGSLTRYWQILDNFAITYGMFGLVLKDIYIFSPDKFRKNQYNTFIKYIVPGSIILLRVLYKLYNFIEYNNNTLGHRLIFYQIFTQWFLAMKITGEFKKHVNEKYFIVVNSIFCVLYGLFFPNWKDKNPLKKKTLVEHFFYNKWIGAFIYGFVINNKTLRKQKDTHLLVIGVITFTISMLFLEKHISNPLLDVIMPNPESLFQPHGVIWHVVGAIGMYYIDRYLNSNIKDI